MTLYEKRSVVNIITSILVTGAYYLYVYINYYLDKPENLDNLKLWATVILVCIPFMIVSKILIYIVFAIINHINKYERDISIQDERDKLIELKANRNSSWIFAFGFMIGLALIVFNQPVYVLFIGTIIGCFLADISSELSQLYYHRKGI